MDGWVAAPAERAVAWTPRTHPAELPGSLLSVVAGQFDLRPVEARAWTASRTARS